MLTPIELDRRIMLIDIVADRSAPRSPFFWAAVVAVVVLGLGWYRLTGTKKAVLLAEGERDDTLPAAE